AWLTEKLSRGKFALAARSHPALALLEGLESLGLGIQGKLALWYALAEVAPPDPRLAGYPYQALEARAVLQHAAVERERLAAPRARDAAEVRCAVGTLRGTRNVAPRAVRGQELMIGPAPEERGIASERAGASTGGRTRVVRVCPSAWACSVLLGLLLPGAAG